MKSQFLLMSTSTVTVLLSDTVFSSKAANAAFGFTPIVALADAAADMCKRKLAPLDQLRSQAM
ncbi:MAG: hypothetical protein P4L40_13665 [Terracidiphilus sp.]|nr:hypothetical protein [Terracidiphilus sp.]